MDTAFLSRYLMLMKNSEVFLKMILLKCLSKWPCKSKLMIRFRDKAKTTIPLLDLDQCTRTLA